MSQSDTRTKIKPLEQVKEPPLFRVVYLNDNQTSMEFVVETLIDYFNYTAETAEQITVDIHETGAAVVAAVASGPGEQNRGESNVVALAPSLPFTFNLGPRG